MPLEVFDRNKFAAEFYHLKIESSIFRVFNPQMMVKLALIYVSLQSPYPIS